MRFTAEQKRVTEAMIRLIELYYRLVEADAKDWFSQPIIEDVAALIDLMIPTFRPCLYFQYNSHFRYGEKGLDIGYRKEHITAFIEIMEVLQSRRNRGLSEWFIIEGRTAKQTETFQANSESYFEPPPHTEDARAGLDGNTRNAVEDEIQLGYYPIQRQRYWAQTRTTYTSTPRASTPSDPTPSVSSLPGWRRRPPRMMASRRQRGGILFSLPSTRLHPAVGGVCGNGTEMKKVGSGWREYPGVVELKNEQLFVFWDIWEPPPGW